MTKTSVIIPSRNERYLIPTVDDLFAKAAGDLEVIVIIEGDWPTENHFGVEWQMRTDVQYAGRLITHQRNPARGLRDAIRTGAAIASGDFILKTDAHCMFAPGFDETLKADCDDDWVVVPRRYALDAENWTVRNDREAIDAHYLSYPFSKPEHVGMHGTPWKERTKERRAIEIDDEMSSQGSAWFMRRAYYQRLGGPSDHGYGTFTQEAQELFNKVWLSGGRCVVNKKTWYAHLWKKDRGYSLPSGEQTAGAIYSAWFWMTDQWADRKYDLRWLIDKFSPVPTWPEDLDQAFAHAREMLGKPAVI